jgi:hypothetical protein
MVKSRKVPAPAGMMRRRVVILPKMARKTKQFEWVPKMVYPDNYNTTSLEMVEEEEREEEPEAFERPGIFHFKELPTEIKAMIYNYALIKRGNKKPALLDALNGEPVLRETALNIYYQINSFTLDLIENIPLTPDIESNDAVMIMKDIKVHVPYAYSPPN